MNFALMIDSVNKGNKDVESGFQQLIEWIWVPIVGVIGHLYMKGFSTRADLERAVASMEKAVSLLQLTTTHINEQRLEDKSNSEKEFGKLARQMHEQHTALMVRIKEVETVVKHRDPE